MIGLRKIDSLKTRITALEGMIYAVEYMRSEIYFRLTPIPEIIKELAKITQPPLGAFFTQCAEDIDNEEFELLWKEALRLKLNDILTDEDIRTLGQLGSVLGRYDLEGQLRSIDSAVAHLTKSKEAAELDKSSNSKVYAALGMAAGVAAVVIII